MSGGACRTVCGVLLRRSSFDPDQLGTGDLKRCLSRWDLGGLGLGSSLGAGAYVLLGSVALRLAGPSVVLSFLVAAVAALLAGLCYAELGARVPRAGSAYSYTRAVAGDTLAFLVGWSLILEGVFGTASVARGLSSHVDSLAGGRVSAWFTAVAPIGAGAFSPYFDFLAFLVVVSLAVLLSVGARESCSVNNVCTILNVVVVAFIVVAGAFKANSQHWSIDAGAVPAGHGAGGFFPYGVCGTLRGAAVCFYGFSGFDVVSFAAEEVRDPRRSIPQAILSVLATLLVLYTGLSIVVTMMVPYYDLEPIAAVATAFTYVDWEWAQWIVSVGAVFGICASLIGALFPLTRLLYSMSSDGLFLHWCATVRREGSSLPAATVLPACCIAILASIMELEQLVVMMCVGTLLAYTAVSACVLILRYRSKNKLEHNVSLVRQLFSCGSEASRRSSTIAAIILMIFMCVCVSAAVVGVHAQRALVPAAILHACALALVVLLALQPQTQEELTFKTPLVPFVPCISIYINIQLMVLVSLQTWLRVAIWICIGIPVYLICLLCYRRNNNKYEENVKAHKDKNGTVQIVVESPTPPNSIRGNRAESDDDIIENMPDMYEMEESLESIKKNDVKCEVVIKNDEIVVQKAVIENNEEKEAKIIDLLDQVLQAEEASYKEICIKDDKEDDTVLIGDSIPHRKSLSELSDAGSDASLGIQVLSKYDVIAQVHREDLPKLSEEEEKVEKDSDTDNKESEESDNGVGEKEEIGENEHEEITAFNDSETNSRTDESGYSDTIDKQMNDSVEDNREETPYIPVPPPLDENYFAKPNFKKSYSIPRPTKQKSLEEEEEEVKPRESIKSNNSQDDGNIVFGSDRQMSFMSKLNNLFQTKMSNEGEEQRRRSNSTGDMAETEVAFNRERPAIFEDLKKELLSLHSVPNLRPVNADIQVENVDEPQKEEEKEDEEEDPSLSRENLKSKLETIFASGGPKLFKPRLMKSNPPTPEEAYQTDTSSTESIPKLPKMEKNDTLKRQKDKFGEVLNSFRLSLTKDDHV